jgi:hypothetical protein
VYLCGVLQCLASARLHAVESYHAFLHGAANSLAHFKNSSVIFNILNYALYARDNDEKDGRPRTPYSLCEFLKWHHECRGLNDAVFHNTNLSRCIHKIGNIFLTGWIFFHEIYSFFIGIAAQIVFKLCIWNHTNLYRVLQKCPCKSPGDQVQSKKLHLSTWPQEPCRDIFWNTLLTECTSI